MTWNGDKTHCPRGHAYEGDNLYVEPKTKFRVCRKCRTRRAREAIIRKVKAKAMKTIALLIATLLFTTTAHAQSVAASQAVHVGDKAYLVNTTANEELVVVYAVSSITSGMLGIWNRVPSARTHGAKGIVSIMMVPGGITWIVITWKRPFLYLRTAAIPVAIDRHRSKELLPSRSRSKWAPSQKVKQ